MKILVGLSGGVDSSVAALILKEQGHDIFAARMAIWNKNAKYNISNENKKGCFGPNEIENIEEAKKIANQLNIPFYTINCATDYEKIVLNNFKEEYLDGHTPNPCVWCNSLIKFGIFPELVKENGRFLLKRGLDTNKDQSYFLYRLTQEQLKNIIMPLGNYTKEQIREIAKKNGLKSAEKVDSQDFYGGDYKDLLNVDEKIGNIVDTNGKILGTHKGFWNYTIGQRKGICISAPEPLYVLELKKETNEVIVGFADKTFKKSLIANQLNWIAINELTSEKKVTAKIRSTQKPIPATIIPINNNEVKVIFDDLQKSIAIGQSAVFYDEDIVIGGGIIQSAE